MGSDSGHDSNGVQINLFNVSGVIYGSTTANIGDAIANAVFSISVASNGVVTLTQFREIDHAGPGEAGGPFDDQLALLGTNKVRMTVSASITDGDGDTATAGETIDLGANVRFADDGPDVDVASVSTSINEGQTINGTYTLAPGADGLGSGTLTISINSVVVATVSAASLLDGEPVPTSVGTFTFGAPNGAGNGTWSLTSNLVTATTNVQISLAVTDGDGDSNSDSHSFTIVNINEPLVVNGAITTVVEEEHINSAQAVGNDDTGSASGSPNNDQDTVGDLTVTTNIKVGTFSSSLSFTGNEGPLTYAFAPVSNGTPVPKAGGGNLTSRAPTSCSHLSGGVLIGYVDAGTRRLHRRHRPQGLHA